MLSCQEDVHHEEFRVVSLLAGAFQLRLFR